MWSNVANANEKKELYCLTEAIYFEGRSEPPIGQLAIANVVLNRVKDRRYPDTICEVVRQCQFSYYCDGKLELMKDKRAMKTATAISRLALDGLEVESIIGATHYHADYVRPYWVRLTTYLSKIGQHKFYKED